jgi:hypothetical protein
MFFQDWFFSPTTYNPQSSGLYFQAFPEDEVQFYHESSQRVEASEPSNLHQGGWSYFDIHLARAQSEHRSSIYQYAPEELMGALMASPESDDATPMLEFSSTSVPSRIHLQDMDNTIAPSEIYNDTPNVRTTCNFCDEIILTRTFNSYPTVLNQ